MRKELKNYAFVDSQNLNLGIQELGLRKIANINWIKNWWGEFSYLSSSYCFDAGYRSSKKLFGVGLSRVLLTHKRGFTTCYLDDADLQKYGKFLVRKISRNSRLLKQWSNELKDASDKIRRVMRKPAKFFIENNQYTLFDDALSRFNPYQIANKAIADYLPPVLFRKYFLIIEEARKYSETVFNELNEFIKKLSRSVSQKEKYETELISALLGVEFLHYAKFGVLPSKTLLKERYNSSGIYFDKGKLQIFSKEVLDLENLLKKKAIRQDDRIKGTTVFSGKVRGICRVIDNKKKRAVFNKGDILVAVMTTPNYMNLIAKAGAIITDAGGILSHAAIVARELKKPCIIGTKIATKVLKDGDLVEVDASRGIVKILK